MPKSNASDEKLKAKVKQQLKQKVGAKKTKDNADKSVLSENDFDTINEMNNERVKPKSSFFSKAVTSQDISMFFRELAILIESGYPLLRALTLLSNKTSNQDLATEIERVAIKVEKGSSMAKAMSFSREYFTPTIISMIEAGETGGRLVEVLVNIAEDYEINDDLNDKIKQALAYPLFTAGVALAVMLLILIVVVPTFATVYDNHKMDVPTTTAILVGLSHFLTGYWWFWLPTMIFGGWFIKNKFTNQAGAFDSLIIKTPVIGEIITLGSMARFANSLRVLLTNGVPIMQSLDLAKGAVGNKVLQEIIQQMRDNVEAGKSMAKPLARAGFLPPIMVDMMFVGEESGKLPFVLTHIVASLRLQLDRIISRLSITLGPIMTLIVGVMVLLITLSLFIPYFGFLTALGNVQ